jgi:multiple sugar transport system substrate-binding protein
MDQLVPDIPDRYRFRNGSGPEHGSRLYQAVQLYDQGAILPIDDVISQWKASGKLDDFLPNTVETLKYDNHYVALPWAIDIRVWYYRKDLFA